MQTVTFIAETGKKKRKIKVLPGWGLLRMGQVIRKEDMVLNTHSCAWEHVTEEMVGTFTGLDVVGIRLHRIGGHGFDIHLNIDVLLKKKSDQ